jgi:hypothetical protein
MRKRKQLSKYIEQFLFIMQLYFAIFISLNLIKSVYGAKPECYSKQFDKWGYQMVLTDYYDPKEHHISDAFGDLSFRCRTFGYGCDSNHSSLNPMQKEGMRIFNKYGKSEITEFLKLIIRHEDEYFPNFRQWFCGKGEGFTRTKWTFKSLRVCPETLRCSPSLLPSLVRDFCNFTYNQFNYAESCEHKTSEVNR